MGILSKSTEVKGFVVAPKNMADFISAMRENFEDFTEDISLPSYLEQYLGFEMDTCKDGALLLRRIEEGKHYNLENELSIFIPFIKEGSYVEMTSEVDSEPYRYVLVNGGFRYVSPKIIWPSLEDLKGEPL